MSIILGCCCLVTQLCPTLCEPMDCSMPSFTVLHIPWNLLRLMPIESTMPSNHLIHCFPLVPLPSIFPSIRIFSNEIALCIRWPKYQNLNFSISPSNEYTGLIFFRIDWFDFLAVQGTLKSFSSTTVWKRWFFSAQPSLMSNYHVYAWLFFDYIGLCQQNDVCAFVCCLIKELNNHF